MEISACWLLHCLIKFDKICWEKRPAKPLPNLQTSFCRRDLKNTQPHLKLDKKQQRFADKHCSILWSLDLGLDVRGVDLLLLAPQQFKRSISKMRFSDKICIKIVVESNLSWLQKKRSIVASCKFSRLCPCVWIFFEKSWPREPFFQIRKKTPKLAIWHGGRTKGRSAPARVLWRQHQYRRTVRGFSEPAFGRQPQGFRTKWLTVCKPLYLFNCLVDLTFSDSLNTQSCALALTHLNLMPHVKRTQAPMCLKEKKRRPTGENNPQARTKFSFSGSPLFAAVLKKI